MTQYLLSVYHPDGGTPPPEVLEKTMRDVDVLTSSRFSRHVTVPPPERPNGQE
jgi:hypothetical protein